MSVTEVLLDLVRANRRGEGTGSPAPVYVIGAEVPTPGGERAEGAPPSVTRVADVDRTLTLARNAFERANLKGAWERVIAIVTQPGVEFGDEVVFDYEPGEARMLSGYLEQGWDLVYEAHSTDYQTGASLWQMVEDHFAILKVGPWLTFAMREALFALESIEREVCAGRGGDLSRLRQTLEAVMLAHPECWESYYRGGDDELRLARAYSYSDRCRYYWPRPELRDAVARLFANLADRPIPLTLVSRLCRNSTRPRASDSSNRSRRSWSGTSCLRSSACTRAPAASAMAAPRGGIEASPPQSPAPGATLYQVLHELQAALAVIAAACHFAAGLFPRPACSHPRPNRLNKYY
jgi:D-tagatose-bisphosphate aldolase class II non-catalytic subunit